MIDRVFADGTMQRTLTIEPITFAEKVGKWAIAILKAFLVVSFTIIAIEIYKDIQAHKAASTRQLVIETKNCGLEYELN